MLISLWQFGSASGLGRVLWLVIGIGAIATGTMAALSLLTLQYLRYDLVDAGLWVQRPGRGWLIPYTDIVAARYQLSDHIELHGYERFWPGAHFADVDTSEGRWRSAATTPPNRRVRIRTRAGLTIAVSPDRPIQFLDALERQVRRAHRLTAQPAAPAQPQPAIGADQAEERRLPQFIEQLMIVRYFRTYMLGDRIISEAIALGLIIFAVSGIYAVYAADGVTQTLVYHWNAAGEPDRLLRPDGPWMFEGIWLFPVMGLIILVTNSALATLLIQTDRFLARLLVGAAPVFQALTLIAMLRLVW